MDRRGGAFALKPAQSIQPLAKLPEGRHQIHPRPATALSTTHGREPFVQPCGIIPPDQEQVSTIRVIRVSPPPSQAESLRPGHQTVEPWAKRTDPGAQV